MTPFTQRIITIIKNIPDGKVMTYGQVAELAGNRRAARQVVRILHSMSQKHGLPWHRVVNVKGQIVIKDDASYFEQVATLQSEGVDVSDEGFINLERYQWRRQEHASH
ncbi:MGMT family protein [Bacillus carboniphilus]|uniref:MGMT family protein n=1 Tax=Bacillus carboniphilus TaxID=86663 RepID=A0ABP3GH67_9BACI